MRLRPLEVRLVASLLQEEAEDAEELAGRIIQALDESREKRDSHCVVAQLGPAYPVTVYGPYSTNQAATKVYKSLAAPGPEEGRAAIVKMRRES